MNYWHSLIQKSASFTTRINTSHYNCKEPRLFCCCLFLLMNIASELSLCTIFSVFDKTFFGGWLSAVPAFSSSPKSKEPDFPGCNSWKQSVTSKHNLPCVCARWWWRHPHPLDAWNLPAWLENRAPGQSTGSPLCWRQPSSHLSKGTVSVLLLEACPTLQLIHSDIAQPKLATCHVPEYINSQVLKCVHMPKSYFPLGCCVVCSVWWMLFMYCLEAPPSSAGVLKNTHYTGLLLSETSISFSV